MPKIIKKQKRKDLTEANRQFGVVLEDINSKMSLVLEGHSVLNKNVDDLKDDAEDLKGEMILLKGSMFLLKDDMGLVKSKLTSIENQFKQKVDIDQFEKLEQRVIRLEKITAR